MSRPRRLLVATLTAAALVSSACSSNYTPRRPGQVAIMLDSGMPTYVRDGYRFKHGFLGGGLVKAVRGHPQAEAAAREYRSRIGTGLVVTLVGTVCAIGTLASTVIRLEDNDSGDVPGELWVSLGCTVLMFGGLFYAVSAEPYRWDAINLFNDGLQQPAYPPPIAPGGGPPGALLPTTSTKKKMSLLPD